MTTFFIELVFSSRKWGRISLWLENQRSVPKFSEKHEISTRPQVALKMELKIPIENSFEHQALMTSKSIDTSCEQRLAKK